MFRLKRYERQEETVYISGPITGVKDWKEKFDKAYRDLKELGFMCVHNPREIADGVNTVFAVSRREPEYRDYMKADLKMLLNCDVIYMLKGWEKSSGAVLERQIAQALKMEIMYEDD